MRIGIFGAGQLGRMLASAGYPLGHTFLLYDSSGTPCPGAGELMVDTQHEQLEEFLAQVDRISFEHEHLDPKTLARMTDVANLYPSLAALKLGQNRGLEKSLFTQLEIPVPRYFLASSLEDLRAGLGTFTFPCIAKTVHGGYDGRGQMILRCAEDALTAWQELREQALIVEEFVDFEREISVIACRDRKGHIQFYAPSENRHKNGILRFSIAPAPQLSQENIALAKRYITRLLERLDYVGVLALELFVTPQGLLANEMATRVHNSGHWTMGGALTSQFENHIRAVADQALGATDTLGVSCMINLIGDYGDIDALLALPFARVHLYGKDPRPGRKLGHVNVIADNYESLYARVNACLALMAEPARFEMPA